MSAGLLIIFVQNADRDWGDVSDNCVGDMWDQNIFVWQIHPKDPTCWVLTNDTMNRLIPKEKSETMQIWIDTDGLVFQVWADSALMLSEVIKVIAFQYA